MGFFDDEIKLLEGGAAPSKRPVSFNSEIAELEKRLEGPKKERGFWETLDRASGTIGAGFNRGVATAMGLPGEVMNFALSIAKVPEEEFRFWGTDDFKHWVNAGGPFTRTVGHDETAAERVLGTVGEVVGGTAALGGPGVGGVRSAVAAVTGSVGAGTAIQTTRELGINSPTVEALAGVVGGVGGAIVPALGPTATQTAKAVGVVGTEKFKEVFHVGPVYAERKASRVLQDQAADLKLAIRNLETEAALGNRPEITPTQLTNDPGLLALESALRREHSSVAGKFEAAKVSLQSFARESASTIGAGSSPTITQRVLQENRRDLIRSLDERVALAQASAAQKTDALRPSLSREEAAVIWKNDLLSAYADGRNAETLTWNYVRGLPETAQTAPIKDTYARLVSQASKAELSNMDEFVPKNIQELITKTYGQAESVNEILSFRHVVLDAMRESRAGKVPSRTAVKNLWELQNAALKTLEFPNAPHLTEETRNGIKGAIAYSKSFNDRFTRGPIGDLLRFAGTGERSVAPAESLEGLIKPSTRGATTGDAILAAMNEPGRKLLGETVKADPERALMAVRQGILDTFVDQTTDTSGRVVASQQKRFLEKHKELLQRFPELQTSLSNASEAQSIAERTLATSTRLQKNLASTSKSVAALFLDKEPNAAMKALFASPRPRAQAEELVRQTKRDSTGRAFNGLQRGVVREWIGAAESGVLLPDGSQALAAGTLRRVFNDNASIFFTTLSRDQIDRAEYITKQLEKFQRSAFSPSAVNVKPIESENILGEMALRVSAVEVAGMLGGHPLAFGATLGRFAKKALKMAVGEPVREILEEAVFNKELYLSLLKRPTSMDHFRKVVLPEFGQHLRNAGIYASGGQEIVSEKQLDEAWEEEISGWIRGVSR